MPSLKGVRALSRTYRLSPSGPLAHPQLVRLPLKQAAPAGEAVVVATSEQQGGPWTYLPAKLAGDRRSVTFTVTHHSLFSVIGFAVGGMVHEFRSLFLDGLDSGATTTVDQPSCDREQSARQGYEVTSTSGPAVYWCLGMGGSSRILRVANDRRYPMEIAHPGMSVAEKPAIDFSQLSSLSHLLSGRESVLAPGGEIGYRVDLPSGGQAQAHTQVDGFGESLYALQTALTTLTEILTRFGASHAGSKIELLDKALGDTSCAGALVAGNPGSILSGCFSAAKLVADFGTAGWLLAPIAAAGGAAAFFASEWQQMHDILTGQDSYRILVTRPQRTVYFASGQFPSDPRKSMQYDWHPATAQLSGDGTYVIQHATWPVWTATEAVADGTANIDYCNPNCAEDKHHVLVPVVATFTKPVAVCGWYFWGQVRLHYPATVPRQLRQNDVWKFGFAASPPTSCPL